MAYVTVQDLRDFGLTEEMASDAKVSAAIVLWSSAIDQITGQWFEPRAATFYLDGSGKDTLHIPVPIISLTEIKINGDTKALETDNYVAYTNRTLPDDRKNPRISFGGRGSTYPTSAKFAVGRQNQYVSGLFGYVEDDLSTPPLIKYALMLLICEKLKNPANPSEDDIPPDEDFGAQGPVIEETTDGHSRKWGFQASKQVRPGIASGITSNPEINRILLMYRAPMAVRVTGRA